MFRGRKITQRFGIKDSGYRLGYHAGVDLAFAEGEKAPAYADGVARYYPGENGGYGNVGTITLSNGDVLWYAHLNGTLVKNGAAVKNDQVAFLTGNTGWSTGPHLHLEYRLKGNQDRVVDPVEKLGDSGEEMTSRGIAIHILRSFRTKATEKAIAKLVGKPVDVNLAGFYNSDGFKTQTRRLENYPKLVRRVAELENKVRDYEDREYNNNYENDTRLDTEEKGILSNLFKIFRR